jgi:hypothetical protein
VSGRGALALRRAEDEALPLVFFSAGLGIDSRRLLDADPGSRGSSPICLSPVAVAWAAVGALRVLILVRLPNRFWRGLRAAMFWVGRM